MKIFDTLTTSARNTAPLEITSGGSSPRTAIVFYEGTLGAGSPVVTCSASRTEGGTYVPVEYAMADALVSREFSIARSLWYKFTLAGGDGTTSITPVMID